MKENPPKQVEWRKIVQNRGEMEENGEKWRNARKKVGKKRQKMKANRWKRGEMEEN